MINLSKLKRYVALVIKTDFESGRRACNLDPFDPNLYCIYQNIEKGIEIRLIINQNMIDYYINKYKDCKGIKIIEGIEKIDEIIEKLEKSTKPQYMITDQGLFIGTLLAKLLDNNEKNKITKILNETKDENEILEKLQKEGVKGIGRIKNPAKKLSQIINEQKLKCENLDSDLII